MSLDIESIRKDFPILEQQVYGKPYIYLDNAATSQTPLNVLKAMNDVYNGYNGNPHRGAHYMSNKTTAEYEKVRDKVKLFINAPTREEVIFTKGTTESINLVAYSFGEAFVNEGDEILVSEMEHHSNIVPWQLLCNRKKANLKVIPFDDKGRLKVEEIPALLSSRTRLLAVTMVSNAMGVVNPVEEIIDMAHSKNVPVLLDAAQAIHHMKVDVEKLGCDFMVFSGHKMYGPTGVGCLFGKKELLDKMPPFMGGGEMIEKVSFSGTTFNQLPYKFEAGTPNFTEVIGLGAAIDYLNGIGINNVIAWEHELLDYARKQLSGIKNIRFFGETEHQSGVISFLVGNIHPYDMGMFLDKMGIAVRTGHHCAEPVMDHFGIPGTVRASFAFYNIKEEIDKLTDAVKKVMSMF
ncbi:MAG: cysteine desulfurase [Prolixibacteraceae bacterium]|nr:cysteine desulfurase [Prolixibacteraceae bacterium]